MGDGADARADRDGRRVHAGPPARHGPHRLLAPAQPRASGAPSSRRRSRPARRARRSGSRRRPRDGAGASSAPSAARVREACLERAIDGHRARAAAGVEGRARRAKALCHGRLRGVPRRARRATRRWRWPSASTATTRCCARCSSSTASATSTRKRERSGLDFEDLELVDARPAGAGRGAARGVRGALRARAGGRVPGHEPAPERAARPAVARQPVPRRRREPVDLPLPQRRRRACSASTGRRAQAEGRAESITVNFRARGELLDAIDLAFERTWGDAFEPLREAPGSREPAPPVDALRRPAGGRPGPRRTGRSSTGDGDPFGEALHGARSGAPPRRACWRSGSTS